MNDIDIQFKIKDFVLTFLESINCQITLENEIYFVTIEEPYSTLLEFKSLKFTFDASKLDSNFCELIAPGSKFLFKLLNYNIKIGPVVLGEIKNRQTSITEKIDQKLGIRFYFFILVEGIKHYSLIKEIDVDLASYKLMKLINCEITPRIEYRVLDYVKDDIDYSYLQAIDNLRKILKQKIDEIFAQILESKNEEINYIAHSFQQQIDDLERHDTGTKNKFEEAKDKTINIKNRSQDSDYNQYADLEEKMNISRNDTIDKIQALRIEEQKMFDIIDRKYRTSIDYALIGSQIFHYNAHDNRITVLN